MLFIYVGTTPTYPEITGCFIHAGTAQIYPRLQHFIHELRKFVTHVEELKITQDIQFQKLLVRMTSPTFHTKNKS